MSSLAFNKAVVVGATGPIGSLAHATKLESLIGRSAVAGYDEGIARTLEWLAPR